MDPTPPRNSYFFHRIVHSFRIVILSEAKNPLSAGATNAEFYEELSENPTFFAEGYPTPPHPLRRTGNCPRPGIFLCHGIPCSWPRCSIPAVNFPGVWPDL